MACQIIYIKKIELYITNYGVVSSYRVRRQKYELEKYSCRVEIDLERKKV